MGGGGVNLFRSRVRETTGYKLTAVHRGLGPDALNACVYPATVLAGGESGGCFVPPCFPHSWTTNDLITPHHTPPWP